MAIVSRGTPAQARRPVEDWVRWTYGEQQAHKVDDRLRLVGQPMGYASRDSVARAAEANALGAVIHGSSVVCRLHPDAELVHDCVTRLEPLWRGLVMDYGITGVPPIGEACTPLRYQAMLRDNGKPKMLLDRHDNIIGCMVEPAVPEITVIYWRKVYLTWWEAMMFLAGRLRDEGLSSCMEVPVAKQAPWLLTIEAGRAA